MLKYIAFIVLLPSALMAQSPTQQAEIKPNNFLPSGKMQDAFQEPQYVKLTELNPKTLKMIVDFNKGIKQPLPKPTPEIDALIKQLGNNECYLRDQAEEKLITKGRDALSAAEENLKNEDFEIKMRCETIIHAFYDVPVQPKSIYYLTNDIRFPDGTEKNKKDVAKDYFVKTKNFVNTWCIANDLMPAVDEDTMQCQNIEKAAAVMYLDNLMRDGGLTKDQAKELATAMDDWRSQLEFPYKNEYSSEWETYTSNSPPGPAERKLVEGEYNQ